MVTPDSLERVAAIARKYQVSCVKLTSGQRIMLVGIQKQDIGLIYQDLGLLAGKESAPCVRYVQGCLGTEACRYGAQDSLGIIRELEERYLDVSFPAKRKFGISGCLRCCAESYLRDIGLVGTTTGWTVIFGGNSGRRPSIGRVIAENLCREDALDLVSRLLEYYRANAEKNERTARFLERTGFTRLESGLLSLLPYYPLENARKS